MPTVSATITTTISTAVASTTTALGALEARTRVAADPGGIAAYKFLARSVGIARGAGFAGEKDGIFLALRCTNWSVVFTVLVVFTVSALFAVFAVFLVLTVSGDRGYFGFEMLDGVVVSLFGAIGRREFLVALFGTFVMLFVGVPVFVLFAMLVFVLASVLITVARGSGGVKVFVFFFPFFVFLVVFFGCEAIVDFLNRGVRGVVGFLGGFVLFLAVFFVFIENQAAGLRFSFDAGLGFFVLGFDEAGGERTEFFVA
jgi:hypothetical protein